MLFFSAEESVKTVQSYQSVYEQQGLPDQRIIPSD